MEGITEGRLVHYVLQNPGQSNHGEHRAAMIVRGWGKPGEAGSEHPNLYVFLDGGNDTQQIYQMRATGNFMGQSHIIGGMLWITSAPYDEETKKPGTWHWPERV